ncbi:hypothetical protein Syun_029928 [Stephania yunnanensis]|uniref:Uncharacterized protein n=1 Tax=Stephania yunnanensis TaxID=152371 RepID=A0AAP0EET7_9MAGN
MCATHWVRVPGDVDTCYLTLYDTRGNTMVPFFDSNKQVESVVDLGYDDGNELADGNGQVEKGMRLLELIMLTKM